MIVLFSRGGAGDFDHLGTRMLPADARTLLANASALLASRGHPVASRFALEIPFEVRHSSNLFGDDFAILFAELPLERYEATRQLGEDAPGRGAFRALAESVTELGTYIRFIAIDLSLAPSPARTQRDAERSLSPDDVSWLTRGYIGVDQGYLGDFTYQTHRDFYRDLELRILPDEYPGTTRARFERILLESPLETQATILRGVLARFPVGSGPLRTPATIERVNALLARLGGIGAVAATVPANTSSVVERALADAEALLGHRDATSAIDRMHTALHGYLLGVCTNEGLSVTRESTLPALLKAIREGHAAFRSIEGARADEITRILRSLGSIVDALNPIRNNASVAHPNERLLAPAEAMLVINTARSILHYIDTRLRG